MSQSAWSFRATRALLLPSLVALGLSGGCQPPSTAIAPFGPEAMVREGALDNDYFIPAGSSGGVGRAQSALTAGDGPSGQQVLYINFDGATIKRVANSLNSDSSSLNESWIPDTLSIGQSIVIPAFDPSPYAPTYTAAQAKADIVTRVTDWYADFNVFVTTTRPTSGRYTMMVVGGVVGNFLMNPAGAVGVAPLDCGNDSQVNIGFVFSTSIATPAPAVGAQQQQTLFLLAHAIAHEAGHSFGLEHTNLSTDIMVTALTLNIVGFLGGSGSIVGSPACMAPATTEVTRQRLLDNLGPAPAGPVLPKPDVAFLAPKNGDVVPRQFKVAVSASQPSGVGGTITKVEIQQAGATVLTMTKAPFQGNVTAQVDGMFAFTAIAYNSQGGKASVQSAFTIQNGAIQKPIGCLINADCNILDECKAGQCVEIVVAPVCDPVCAAGELCQADGSCAPDPAAVDMAPAQAANVGATCVDSSECTGGGICAARGGTKYCTVQCESARPDSCPVNYECVAVGADHYCGPKASGCSAAGSSVAGSSPVGLPLAAPLIVFAGFCLVLRRRRSASPSVA